MSLYEERNDAAKAILRGINSLAEKVGRYNGAEGEMNHAKAIEALTNGFKNLSTTDDFRDPMPTVRGSGSR